MAITTYTELRSAVQRWLDNDNPNLIAAIPDFIALAEASLNDSLYCRERECRISTPLVPTPPPADPDDYGVYDLPEDWGGHRSLERVGDLLWILYWQRIPSLSDETPTNWLLLRRPDIYLMTALANSEAFLKNDPRTQLWGSASTQAIEEFLKADDRERYSGSPLRARVDVERDWADRSAWEDDRLEYLPPWEFFDIIARAHMAGPRENQGYYTVTEGFIRIWPKPEVL